MKIKFKKIFIILFLLLIIGLNIQTAMAAYKIEVSLPVSGGPSSGDVVSLTQYIKYLYMFGLGLVGISALLALVIGGFMYMGAETVTTKDQAKGYINGAISGLILGLAAYLILYTINPDLTNFKITPPPVQAIPETGQQTTPANQTIPANQNQICSPGNCPSSCQIPCHASEYWDSDICTCRMLGS